MDQLRVSYCLDAQGSTEEEKDVLYFRNEERTKELQKVQKYVEFHDWLAKHGAIYPAVDYPVAFGKEGQLIGMGAKKDIPPQTAFLFVPQKLLISEFNVRVSKIGFMLQKHPDIFRDHYDSEYLVLIIFLFYEMLKGKDSFWYPYFQIINISDLPMLWSDEEIDELQDQVLKKDVLEYRREFEEEWKLIYQALRDNKDQYEQYFPGISDENKESELKQVFTKAFVSIVTRCFGWGLPKTMVIPFADCINHHNVDSTYELIHTKYHLAVEKHLPDHGPESYYQSSKMDLDYSDLFIAIGEQEETKEKKSWPNKTLNQIKKFYKRNETRQMKITSDIYDKNKHIWDIDYLSSSDEEDNDSDDNDDEDEQQDQTPEQSPNNEESKDTSSIDQHHISKAVQRKRPKIHKGKEVITMLLSKNPELEQRDLQARLFKIQLWKKQRQRFGLLEEDQEGDEDFKWQTYDDDNVYYAMGTKYKTFFKKGDQLFNCYGRRTNRFLMINYGFCLRHNKYNSLGFKVFVNYNKNQTFKEKGEPINESTAEDEDQRESPSKKTEVADDTDQAKYQKIIRLKKERLCEDLLQYLRANLIFNYKGKNLEKLLVSAPVDVDFEMFIIACALNLMKGMLNTKYPTTLEQDYELMEKPIDNWRKHLALIHRINQKEILSDQVKYLSIMMRILARIKEGSSLKGAYCMRVSDVESEDESEILMNRIRLRKYLREFQHYQMTLFQNKLVC